MFIIKHRPFFFWLTGLILAAAIAALIAFPLKLSIEFTGGSLIEVAYTEHRIAAEDIRTRIAGASADYENPLVLDGYSLRESGDTGYTIRTRTLSPEEHDRLIAVLSSNGANPMSELRFNSIGPSLGSELAIKALYAIGAVMLAIVLYIALVFRKVSRPVPSWGYGLVVVAMLAIDIIVPAGFFAAYAHFTGAQADPLFVVALLALLGYCVNDVIVIFDRVRENLKKNADKQAKEAFEVTVGRSIDETIVRSINTSLTVALALIAIIVFGAEATRNFALVMLVGVVIGTFSSICRSAPLLVPLAKKFAKE
jgi:preprotein translocase subunit SecF